MLKFGLHMACALLLAQIVLKEVGPVANQR